MNCDLILSADWHIRDDIPECRTDNFLEAQTIKFEFIKDLQKKYRCPVVVAGDIFNHWKPSPSLISLALELIPDLVYTIPGNHDLPAHSLENVGKSGINALAASKSINMLTKRYGYKKRYENIEFYGFPFGVPLRNVKRSNDYYRVAIIHSYVYKGKEPFPGAADIGNTAKALCKKLSGFDLIVTGDNHQTIVEKVGDTLLVNAGSLMRTSAAQIDHEPCVFLWDAEHGKVTKRLLPFHKEAVSREHLEMEKEREERSSVFIQRLNSDIVLSNVFKENVKRYLAKNKIKQSVSNLVKEACDGI